MPARTLPAADVESCHAVIALCPSCCRWP